VGGVGRGGEKGGGGASSPREIITQTAQGGRTTVEREGDFNGHRYWKGRACLISTSANDGSGGSHSFGIRETEEIKERV